jgi:Hint module
MRTASKLHHHRKWLTNRTVRMAHPTTDGKFNSSLLRHKMGIEIEANPAQYIEPQCASANDEQGFCFAGETLVHTQEGLKPIKEIQVGDSVLSLSEQNGEKTFKRVLRTVKSDQKPIFRVSCYLLSGESHQDFLVTGNHLLFVSGYVKEYFSPNLWEFLDKRNGWQRADDVQQGELLQLASGDQIKVSSVDPVWRTRNETVGWIDADRHAEIGYNLLIDDPTLETIFAGHGVVADFFDEGNFCDRYDDQTAAELWSYKCSAYNLEIEDFHTYFIGNLGILVRDVT